MKFLANMTNLTKNPNFQSFIGHARSVLQLYDSIKEIEDIALRGTDQEDPQKVAVQAQLLEVAIRQLEKKMIEYLKGVRDFANFEEWLS